MMNGGASGAVFLAHTLIQGQDATGASVGNRPRLELPLSQRLREGSHLIVSGPAGSGKTVLALQIALRRADRVHYICARGLPHPMASRVSPPDPLVEPVADLLNALVEPDGSKANAQIARWSQLSVADSLVVVIDDLDLVSYQQVAVLRDGAARLLARFVNATFILITRHTFEETATFFDIAGQVRVVSADLLAIQREELPGLISSGCFGHGNHDEIEEAYQQVGGWFAGIQRMVDPAVMSMSTLDDYVLNEILMRTSRQVQNVLIALGKFPCFSNELVRDMLASLGESVDGIANLFSQVPMCEEGGSGLDATTFTLSPQLCISLGRLERFIENQSVVQKLYRFGIQWFVKRSEYDNARLLAIASGTFGCYLEEIIPLCAALASEEHWVDIRSMLIDIPIDLLNRSSDLVFWRMIAESYLGNLNELSSLVGAIHENWRDSDSAIRRGRADLMVAWRHWGQSQPERALEYASRSIAALPEEAIQDRMFAVITAENAARNIGDSDQIEYWSSMNARTRPVAAVRLEWWHMNCGYHRLSHLASTGRLNHAYQLADLSLDQISGAYPRAAFRYVVLQAYIDLEAGRRDRVEERLAVAQSLSNGVMTENELELLRAHIALEFGDVELVRHLLRVERGGERTRPDQYLHRVRILAEAEMVAGNIDLAHDIVMSWCQGEDAWPKYFGESNHYHVQSKVLARQGRFYDAISISQYVINECRRRNLVVDMVMALAIQAECYSKLGRGDRLEHVLAAASDCVMGESYLRSFSPFDRDVRILTPSDTEEPDPLWIDAPAMAAFQTSPLTKREMELLKAAADGVSTREIAELFFISQSTVKNHLTSIYRKLGVNSRSEAIGLVFPTTRFRPE